MANTGHLFTCTSFAQEMWAAKFLLVAVGVTTACLNNRHVSTSDALGLAAQTKGGGKFSLHPVLGRPIGRKVMEDRSLRASENSEAEKACSVEARKQYGRERSARREAHVSSRRKLAGVTAGGGHATPPRGAYALI